MSLNNERISRIMQKLVDIFPEQRYCQIISNALTFYRTGRDYDLFYVDDEALHTALWAYYNAACNGDLSD